MSSRTASVRELRAQLGELLDEVASGTQVVVTRRGRPIARLVPEPQSATTGKTHPLRGSLRRVSRDFDEPIEELWEAGSR